MAARRRLTMDIKNALSTEIDLNSLRMFVAVADAASFSAAAERLNLPKWSVSRRLSQLEAALGVPLLHRTTRRVVLSPVGAALHERIAPLLSSIEQAASELSDVRGEPVGEVRISAPNYLSSALLAEPITRFAARYPRIRFDLYLHSNPLDFAVEGYDVALRAGPQRMKDSSLVARPACPIYTKLFASPEYLEESGVPRQPEDLSRHRWIAHRGVPSLTLESHGGPVQVKPQGAIVCDDVFFVRESVRAGGGIGFIPTFLVEKDLARGRLVTVLPQYHSIAAHIYILRPGTREIPRRVRLFCDFLVEYLDTHALGVPLSSEAHR